MASEHAQAYFIAAGFTFLATFVDVGVNKIVTSMANAKRSDLGILKQTHQTKWINYAAPLVFACVVAIIVDLLWKRTELPASSAKLLALDVAKFCIPVIGVLIYGVLAGVVARVEQELEIHSSCQEQNIHDYRWINFGPAEMLRIGNSIVILLATFTWSGGFAVVSYFG